MLELNWCEDSKLFIKLPKICLVKNIHELRLLMHDRSTRNSYWIGESLNIMMQRTANEYAACLRRICKRSDQRKIERVINNDAGWYYVESLTGQRYDRVQTESQELQPWTAVWAFLQRMYELIRAFATQKFCRFAYLDNQAMFMGSFLTP